MLRVIQAILYNICLIQVLYFEHATMCMNAHSLMPILSNIQYTDSTPHSDGRSLQNFSDTNDDTAPITVPSLSHISLQRETDPNKLREATGTIAGDYKALPISEP